MEEPGGEPYPVETQQSVTEPAGGTLSPVDSADKTKETQGAGGGLRLLREIIETILLTAAIFIVVNTLTGRFRIEGPSMLPNLHEGQYLIVNKLVYRLHPPARGDIIVFQQSTSPRRDLIKRVIGLPGETVDIRGGQVYVDDVRLTEPYVEYHDRRSAHYELGPDEYFVLGDNRPDSDDSRSWGPLDRSQIIGKVWISYWPPNTWGGMPHYSYGEEGTGA